MSTLSWRASPWQRAQIAAISGLGYPLLAALGSTYRFRVDGLEHLRAAGILGQPIHAFWHGRILPATIYFKRRGIVVITSENFDGEWIARIIRRFGYDTARGSTSRGGARALAQLRREMRAGRPAAFTIDGPRGPARVAQPGAVWLASVTGQPIVPFHIEAARFWTVNSWDRHQVPKPGSDVAISIGDLIDVPSEADDGTIEHHRQELQHTLTRLEAQARGLLGP
jgi:lysophospholipid acyltransferase (LPLAT)-like uncharacterized protein